MTAAVFMFMFLSKQKLVLKVQSAPSFSMCAPTYVQILRYLELQCKDASSWATNHLGDAIYFQPTYSYNNYRKGKFNEHFPSACREETTHLISCSS